MMGFWEGWSAELELKATLPSQLEDQGTQVCFPAPPLPELPGAIGTHDGLSVAIGFWLAWPREERPHRILASNPCL